MHWRRIRSYTFKWNFFQATCSWFTITLCCTIARPLKIGRIRTVNAICCGCGKRPGKRGRFLPFLPSASVLIPQVIEAELFQKASGSRRRSTDQADQRLDPSIQRRDISVLCRTKGGNE